MGRHCRACVAGGAHRYGACPAAFWMRSRRGFLGWPLYPLEPPWRTARSGLLDGLVEMFLDRCLRQCCLMTLSAHQRRNEEGVAQFPRAPFSALLAELTLELFSARS